MIRTQTSPQISTFQTFPALVLSFGLLISFGGSNELALSQEPAGGGSWEAWKPVILEDPMTDKKTLALAASLKGSNGGSFDVIASCEDETLLRLNIKSRIASRELLKTRIPKNNAPEQSCVLAQTRIGSQETKARVSSQCVNDDSATLDFRGILSEQRASEILRADPSVVAYKELIANLGKFTGLPNELGNIPLQAAVQAANLKAASDGSMNDFIASDVVRIQVPLDDRSQSVIRLHPQESNFKTYTAKCMSMAPPPPPAPQKPFDPLAPVDTFVPANANTLAARTFEGSVDQFAAELPSFIERALVLTHLPSRDYTKEINFIVDQARTCLTITPQMVANTRSVRGTLMTGEWGPKYFECGRPDNGSPTWGQYATNVTDKTGGGGSDYSRRDLHMRINPIGGFASGQGIAVTVFLEFRQSDNPSFSKNLDSDPTHRIVFAKLK